MHSFNFKNTITKKVLIQLFLFLIAQFTLYAQSEKINEYNIKWNTSSINSSENMPCGGGDIGLNVWVEKGEILLYISRSGTFDENNGFLKLGRIRLVLTPNPFVNESDFHQELKLNDGYIEITASGNSTNATVKIWVDVYKPVIHLSVDASKPVYAEAIYENWRYKDMVLRKNESFANSFKWAPLKGMKTFRDSIKYHKNSVLFYHRNNSETVFDVTVHQQGMDSVKSELHNPLSNLTFGGAMWSESMVPGKIDSGIYLDTDYKGWSLISSKPQKKHSVHIALHTDQTNNTVIWEKGLYETIKKASKQEKVDFEKSKTWWNNYWERSFIYIEDNKKIETNEDWQVGRNYQLFRYMLGCNAFGSYPTKFNGGLFTYDPCFTDSNRCFTPDYRNWGGGTFTAQNQRLVYFPMLKSGDFELLKPQFDFYLGILANAELRSKFYWGHSGACFTEQIENFGLPNCSEYGWKRPDWYDKGMQYNAWLEYQWDTALEFCYMILETHHYANKDILKYMPLIKSCLVFFDEHYQYLAKQRGRKALDENGNLVLYPGSSCETYKMAYNATSTIIALKTVLKNVIQLPDKYNTEEDKEYYKDLLDRIPPLEFRQINGYTTISPAKLWERINNTEVPQLYPVFPWGVYGVGKPGLDTALNTWLYDPDAIKFRSHIGWKQDNIFAARLGLAEDAFNLTSLKLKDSERRFPAYWGPGFDWVPDHNWGGSGMIGLQEMLLQTAGEKIFILPAWPKNKDVHFKLHAPYNTIVEVEYKNRELINLEVTPVEREKDVVLMFESKKN